MAAIEALFGTIDMALFTKLAAKTFTDGLWRSIRI